MGSTAKPGGPGPGCKPRVVVAPAEGRQFGKRRTEQRRKHRLLKNETVYFQCVYVSAFYLRRWVYIPCMTCMHPPHPTPIAPFQTPRLEGRDGGWGRNNTGALCVSQARRGSRFAGGGGGLAGQDGDREDGTFSRAGEWSAARAPLPGGFLPACQPAAGAETVGRSPHTLAVSCAPACSVSWLGVCDQVWHSPAPGGPQHRQSDTLSACRKSYWEGNELWGGKWGRAAERDKGLACAGLSPSRCSDSPGGPGFIYCGCVEVLGFPGSAATAPARGGGPSHTSPASRGDCMATTVVMGWATPRTEVGQGQERCPETPFSQERGVCLGCASTSRTRNVAEAGGRKESPLNPAR